MSSADSRRGALDAIRAVHAEIDEAAKSLAQVHAERLQCRRGCSACCVDDLTVTRIEAERIRSAHAELLANGAPHASGACAFLDEDQACRIYTDRPQVCRSQGLPLRILFEDEAGEIEERRDICPLNAEGGPSLESLDEDQFWLVGPFELKIQQLDDALGGDEWQGDDGRVALRELFERLG